MTEEERRIEYHKCLCKTRKRLSAQLSALTFRYRKVNEEIGSLEFDESTQLKAWNYMQLCIQRLTPDLLKCLKESAKFEEVDRDKISKFAKQVGEEYKLGEENWKRDYLAGNYKRTDLALWDELNPHYRHPRKKRAVK